ARGDELTTLAKNFCGVVLRESPNAYRRPAQASLEARAVTLYSTRIFSIKAPLLAPDPCEVMMLNVSFGSSRTRLIAAAGGLRLLLASLADAAPAITGISGSGTDGSTVTITGNGFGSGDSTPMLWDDFDDTSLSTGAAISKSPRVGSWVTFTGSSYSTAQ